MSEKEMPTSSASPTGFFVWITALTEVYDDLIIAALVKKGYIISAAAVDKSTVTKTPNSVSAIIALRVETFDKKKSIDINNDVIDIMTEKKMMYYSIVVAPAIGAVSWVATNIKLNEKKTSTSPPPLPPNTSNLN